MEGFKHYRPTSAGIEHKRRYHVFLSFRGTDVRKGLVDHLFQSLSTAGLHVFLDSERLEKGENIGESLEKAIEDSTLYLPIFSPDYASSAWCLKELSHIWKICRSGSRDRKIIPLFYNMEPSHVRFPEGEKSPYAQAFQKHNEKGRQRKEEMDEWKEALHGVSLLSGWSLRETSDGYEGKLVKQVVMDLLTVFNIHSLSVAKRPVGLKDRMEKVKTLLQTNDIHQQLSVGIWGMGGLGKTTLSKAIYNDIHHLFEASSFVSNIRATAKESVKGLRELQIQVLKDLVKVSIKLNSVDHGKIQMKNHLASVRALVILDDVDDEEQLDALVGDWYGAGSIIIITTRDREVLERGQIDTIYPMEVLQKHEGVELFCWHAFLRARPDGGYEYEDMTEKIVNACDGLPLSLEIMGAHLYGKRDLRYWSEALEKIRSLRYEKVYQALKVSYDALEDEEKQIFLDIACCFISLRAEKHYPCNKEFYIKFWKVLGCKAVLTSIKNLEGKSLIVIKDIILPFQFDPDLYENHPIFDNHPIFEMHDHVRDLGRRIVKEESLNNPSKWSRLWCEQDIVSVTNRLAEVIYSPFSH